MATIIVQREDAAQNNLSLVCMVCARPAVGYRLKRFLLGGRHVLHAPLCAVHQDHWRNRALLVLSGSVAASVLLILGFALLLTTSPDSLALFCGGVLILVAVFFILAMLVLYAALRYTAIRVIGSDEHTIALHGVANGFVAAYQLEDTRRNAGAMVRSRQFKLQHPARDLSIEQRYLLRWRQADGSGQARVAREHIRRPARAALGEHFTE